MRRSGTVALAILALSLPSCGNEEKCKRALDDLYKLNQQLHNGVFTIPDDGSGPVPNLTKLTDISRKYQEAKDDSVAYCRQ